VGARHYGEVRGTFQTNRDMTEFGKPELFRMRLPSQHTASPSVMHERKRSRARAGVCRAASAILARRP
jgi:hypothetical protein